MVHNENELHNFVLVFNFCIIAKKLHVYSNLHIVGAHVMRVGLSSATAHVIRVGLGSFDRTLFTTCSPRPASPGSHFILFC